MFFGCLILGANLFHTEKNLKPDYNCVMCMWQAATMAIAHIYILVINNSFFLYYFLRYQKERHSSRRDFFLYNPRSPPLQ